jgi:hypothetical protein
LGVASSSPIVSKPSGQPWTRSAGQAQGRDRQVRQLRPVVAGAAMKIAPAAEAGQGMGRAPGVGDGDLRRQADLGQAPAHVDQHLLLAAADGPPRWRR